MKTAIAAIVSNVALLTIGVLIQQTVLTEEISKQIMDRLLPTAFGRIFPMAYMGMPIAVLAACIYCMFSHYRYERRKWKLVVGMSAPGVIGCSLIFPFNLFLCCALIT